MQRGRPRAVSRREQAVARTHGETVRLAQRRAAHDLGVEKKGAREAFDELELLEVLLPEVRALRARKEQELQHDGQHAVEMPGTRGDLQIEAALALGDSVAIAVAVDLLRARQEHQIASGDSQHAEVLFDRAWIAR